MTFSNILRFALITAVLTGGRGFAYRASAFTVSGAGGWEADIDETNGALRSYTSRGVAVPFRTDTLAGPQWRGVAMQADPASPLKFYGVKDGIVYSLRYIPQPDHLAVEAAISNTGASDFRPASASLIIGTDSEMHRYPQWNDRFFPTLLRCERDFAWGYFQSPEGNVLAVGTEQPVASYSLDYIYRGIKEWRWGHQIFTAEWDVLHGGKLPERHPSGLDCVKAGERLSVTMHLGVPESIDSLKPTLSRWLKAPMVELDSYTVAPGEDNTLTVWSDRPVTVTASVDGTPKRLKVKQTAANVFTVAGLALEVAEIGEGAELLRSVDGVGNKFAKEYLVVAVEEFFDDRENVLGSNSYCAFLHSICCVLVVISFT